MNISGESVRIFTEYSKEVVRTLVDCENCI